MKKLYCVICSMYRKFKILKYNIFSETTLVLSIIWSKYEIEEEIIFKEESNEILKILGLIENI